MNKINRLSPVIRFSEFTQEWNSYDFKEIVEKSSKKIDPQKSNKNYQCIELESIEKETGLLLKVFNSKDQQSSKSYFNKGEILYGKLRPNLRKYLITPFEGVCSSEIWVFNGQKVINEFLHKLIQTSKFYQTTLITFGSKMPRADWNFVSNYPFYIPTLPEQKKIANFLTAVDKKIELLSRKKELLEQYKKGVMQKIFSQEIRFKQDDGRDFPDWEEKRLGEIGEFKNGINKNKQDFGFGYDFINLLDVFGKPYISKSSYGKVNASEKELLEFNVKQGDILFIRSSVKRTGVGETSLVLDNLENTVYSGFLIRFRESDSRFYLDYKKYCFFASSFRKCLLSYATTSANTNINQESLVKININIPTIYEQKKISNFLSLLDNKISSIQNKLAQTQIFKKGLLQKMFV